MNKFRQAGFISYNGHIEVHSALLSVVLTDPARSVNLPFDACGGESISIGLK